MGVGHYTNYAPKAAVQLTFGMLREDDRGFTVICRKCGHRSFVDPKSMRYLASRLRDDLKLHDADGMFRRKEMSV